MILTKSRFLLIGLVLLFMGCMPGLHRSFLKGDLPKTTFKETVACENNLGLLILPVTIRGKSYRFLFDSGAPLSLSKEIQEELGFKQVTKSMMRDSDGTTRALKFVKVDTIHVGSIPFIDQTAFVGDFKAHPILECMQLDGILGSNMMRYCNWTIDYQNLEITLFKGMELDSNLRGKEIAFRSNGQFDMITEWEAKGHAITNIKVDYGSVYGLTLPKQAISKLQEYEVFDTVFAETGWKRSGLFAQSSPFEGVRAFTDSMKWGEIELPNLEVKTGHSGLIGSKVLSRFVVTIDWSKRRLHFAPVQKKNEIEKTFGLGLGYNEEKGVFVQTLVHHSVADQAGIKPGMKVLKLNTLKMGDKSSYCGYIRWANSEDQQMNLWLVDESDTLAPIQLIKSPLF
ncbi:aspartyl protease family protein [bacterium SCSIO 12741]|nr:aspartyl protease family protein [bacterium SCSIO 12741]